MAKEHEKGGERAAGVDELDESCLSETQAATVVQPDTDIGMIVVRESARVDLSRSDIEREIPRWHYRAMRGDLRETLKDWGVPTTGRVVWLGGACWPPSVWVTDYERETTTVLAMWEYCGVGGIPCPGLHHLSPREGGRTSGVKLGAVEAADWVARLRPRQEIDTMLRRHAAGDNGYAEPLAEIAATLTKPPLTQLFSLFDNGEGPAILVTTCPEIEVTWISSGIGWFDCTAP